MRFQHKLLDEVLTKLTVFIVYPFVWCTAHFMNETVKFITVLVTPLLILLTRPLAGASSVTIRLTSHAF